MLSIALVLALAGGDAVAEAGSAYRQAREALEAERYEQAVKLLETALKQVGDESDLLKYRDDTSRRRHSYYPYYEWGRARLMQSQTETSIFTQRDQLADAVSHLGQSRHPDAAVKLEEARAKLEDVQKSIALDGSFNAVKTKIEVLGTNERFVEAFKEHTTAAGLYKTRLKELDEVLGALKIKQAATIKRYEDMLASRLNEIVLVDPVTRGDSIVPMLNPALVPPLVTPNAGPTFEWAARFIKLWESEAEAVKKPAALTGEKVIATAGAFDALGLEALTLNLPSGFRASRALAQTTRLGKLRDIDAGSEDVLDTKTADAVVASARAASKRGAEAADKLAADVKDTLTNDLSGQEKQINDLAKSISDGAKQRTRLTAPIVQAELQLKDGDKIGDIDALKKLQQDVYQLETEANFSTLTPRLKARALFAKALAAATQTFLEGGKELEAIEQARVPATRAYGFDPQVESRWSALMSKKMVELFKKLKPQ